MNVVKKIAICAAFLGAVTIANAQQMTIGVIVPAEVSVDAFGVILPAAALLNGTGAITATSPTVGFFKVSSNMPNWNLTISADNGGFLKNSKDSAFTTDLTTDGQLGATTAEIFLCPTKQILGGVPNSAIAACGAASGTNISNPAGGVHVGLCDISGGGAVCSLAGPTAGDMVEQGSRNEFTYDVKTVIAGTEVNSLAGIYTETLRLVLTGTF